MAERILYLVADTNLFVQCRPLHTLDWSKWKDWDEVHVLVTRVVQREIDRQKNGRSGRLATRARGVSAMFRELLQGSKVVHNASPVVKLVLSERIAPSPNLEANLDYGEADDQLVGIAHALATELGSENVLVLTHDTGPMASAKAVGVGFKAIPDEWLSSPEPSEADQQLRKAQAEIERLRSLGPRFAIEVRDMEGSALDRTRRLHLTHKQYLPLSEFEIEGLMTRLRERHPQAAEYSEDPLSRLVSKTAIGLRTDYVPATPRAIEKYETERYPGWIAECETLLRGLHTELNKPGPLMTIQFVATNTGSQPAKDALVSISASGDCLVLPQTDGDAHEADPNIGAAAFALPRPPVPPRGRRVARRIVPDFSVAHAFPTAMSRAVVPLPLVLARDARYHVRDRDSFYYKDRPDVPCGRYELECAQWRHSVEPEAFGCELHADPTSDGGGGLLTFRIHAANLVDPETLKIPLTIERIELSALDAATDLVERVQARALDQE